MLNERLRELRENRNLTQKDAAIIFDISRERYNQYETGKRRPDYDTLIVFADYFEVTTDYLLGRSGNQQSITSQSSLITPLSENERELLELFRQSNYRQQLKIIGHIEEIIKQITIEETNHNDETGGFKSNDVPSTLSKKEVG